MPNSAEILYGPNGGMCYHNCGAKAESDGYCDRCYADQCLVGPDGNCRYNEDGDTEDE